MIVIENKQEFKQLIKETLKEVFSENEEEKMNLKVYSKTATKNMLGISFGKVQKLIESGHLQTTGDKAFVTFASIKEYVGTDKNILKNSLGRLETSQQ